mgnify:CR=1 FL=1
MRRHYFPSILGPLFGVAFAFLPAEAATAAAAPPPRIELKLPPKPEPVENDFPRPVNSDLETQIALAREGISSGSIDGVRGPQTAAALRAFQERENLPPSGELDEATRSQLLLTFPAFTQVALTPDDLNSLQALSPTWLGKSEQTALSYETALELVAERAHASPALLRKLNPNVDWTQLPAGTQLTVPDIPPSNPNVKAARLHIRLAERTLQARAEDGRLLAHFPVSIARMAEKRPGGELHVTVVIPDPNYTFDPEVFPESEEGRELGRKLVLPPGPNNPVGVAWIGLDRPGYGIHGTPLPESVGRTESHGCFRLANWNARTLLSLAWVGLPVVVDP